MKKLATTLMAPASINCSGSGLSDVRALSSKREDEFIVRVLSQRATPYQAAWTNSLSEDHPDTAERTSPPTVSHGVNATTLAVTFTIPGSVVGGQPHVLL